MKTFGHRRPTRNTLGDMVDSKESPAKAVTQSILGSRHGPDRQRRLVVSLIAGDLIEFRPYGTSRKYVVGAVEAYEWLLRTKANCALLEKARAKKAKRAERLARQRQERAEKRLFKS